MVNLHVVTGLLEVLCIFFFMALVAPAEREAPAPSPPGGASFHAPLRAQTSSSSALGSLPSPCLEWKRRLSSGASTGGTSSAPGRRGRCFADLGVTSWSEIPVALRSCGGPPRPAGWGALRSRTTSGRNWTVFRRKVGVEVIPAGLVGRRSLATGNKLLRSSAYSPIRSCPFSRCKRRFPGAWMLVHHTTSIWKGQQGNNCVPGSSLQQTARMGGGKGAIAQHSWWLLTCLLPFVGAPKKETFLIPQGPLAEVVWKEVNQGDGCKQLPLHSGAGTTAVSGSENGSFIFACCTERSSRCGNMRSSRCGNTIHGSIDAKGRGIKIRTQLGATAAAKKMLMRERR